MTKMTDERLDEIFDKRGDLTPVGKELLREIKRLRKQIVVLEGSLDILRLQNDKLRNAS